MVRDWPLVRRNAHTLKSSFAYLGGVRPEQACHELEVASMQGEVDPDAAKGMLEKIQNLYKGFLSALIGWQEQSLPMA